MSLAIVLIASVTPLSAQIVIGGQQGYDIDYLTPKEYEIGGIDLENAENFDSRMVLLVAGLQVGDKVKVPGDKISTAVDNLWKQGMFEDVQIVTTRIQGGTIFLKIILKERPKLSKFDFKGVKKNDVDKINKELNIASGDVVTENLLRTSRNKIRSFYLEKGFNNVDVETRQTPDTVGGKGDRVIVTFAVKTGKRVKIDSMVVKGNETINTNKILSQMKKTHDVHYAKKMYVWTPLFWKRSKYREADFDEDLSNIIEYYNEQGYRNAKIVRDTMYQLKGEELRMSDKKKAKQDRLRVEFTIYEGEKFYFRNITFTGNTIYSSEELAKHLRIEKGDPYNKTTLETNLHYNPAGTDVTAMYMDNGYLFFDATPVEVAVENDSIDIEIRIVEGKQARIKNVTVEGNTVTNDKIIYRELHTKPGDLFSREALLRSQRELVTLGYFKQEKIQPDVHPNSNDGTVDVIYKVEEQSTSQLQLQGGYGSKMLIGQLSVQLNNFSAKNIFNKKQWNPLPAGDGQKLGINLVSNGTAYYAINGSFTEPWLGGKRPQSLSVSVYHNLYSNGYFYDKDEPQYYSLMITGAGVSLSKRLKWPDDYFVLSQGLTYKHYILNNYTQLTDLLTNGAANDLSYGITLSRNSYDSPIYPRSGSDVSISGYITPPWSLMSGKDYSEDAYKDFVDNYEGENAHQAWSQQKYKWIEYYKLNVKGSWMLNLVGDVVLNARFRFGYMGYFNQQIGLAPFGRYYVGGNGLQTFVLDGREVIPLRGYQDVSVGVSKTNEGSLFDKFTLELRQPIIESASTTIWVQGFLEGGNCWNKIADFQPFKMYNSAGLGVRLYMPMFGLIGVDWGYGFDGTYGGSQFHFIIGQSIE